MIKFEFLTKTGVWYLDDVSIREKYATTIQLVNNGDFETGHLGTKWEYCHVVHSWFSAGYVTQLKPYKGTYSFASSDFGSPSHDYLTQIMNIKGATSYVIEFYLAFVGNAGSTTVTLDAR